MKNGKKLILIADDDKEIRDILNILLSKVNNPLFSFAN